MFTVEELEKSGSDWASGEGLERPQSGKGDKRGRANVESVEDALQLVREAVRLQVKRVNDFYEQKLEEMRVQHESAINRLKEENARLIHERYVLQEQSLGFRKQDERNGAETDARWSEFLDQKERNRAFVERISEPISRFEKFPDSRSDTAKQNLRDTNEKEKSVVRQDLPNSNERDLFYLNRDPGGRKLSEHNNESHKENAVPVLSQHSFSLSSAENSKHFDLLAEIDRSLTGPSTGIMLKPSPSRRISPMRYTPTRRSSNSSRFSPPHQTISTQVSSSAAELLPETPLPKRKNVSAGKPETPRVSQGSRIFFRETRDFLSEDEFDQLLMYMKELNTGARSREETVNLAEALFRSDGKDLFQTFKKLLYGELLD